MGKSEYGITKYKKKIIEIILKYVPTAQIYLFGSRAKGTHHETSDIDIALDIKSKIERNVVLQIKSAIDALNIPYNIDIVDFRSVSEILRKQIERDRILWN